MSLSYLSEAFKNLEFLEEEDFNLSDKKDLDELNDLIHEEPEDTVEIMSMDFDDLHDPEDQEVEETHVGDVILDCPVCHSKLYKNSDEVIIDEEEQLANVGEECPYCYTADGFKIIGQVAPYQPEDEVTVDIEDKEEIEDSGEEVEEKEKEDVVEESLTRKSKRKIKESKSWETSHDDDVHKFRINWIDSTGCINNNFQYAKTEEEAKEKFLNDSKTFVNSVRKIKYIDQEDFLESITESKEVDLTEYQKWVDYDMKKYHKISKNTMNKIKSAGLSVVKDQYGDYEVIAKRADSDVKESFKRSIKKGIKESKLTEKSWNYTLKNGSLLRDAIDEEDLQQVQQALIDCYDELHDNNLIDDDDYESYVEDVRMLDPDDYDAEDEFDYQLNEFYDLCDNLNVWVAMNESLKKSKKVREGFEKVELETDDQKITVKSEPREVDPGEQMIVPLEPEVKDSIEDNTLETEEETEETPEDEIDIDTTEFDEESFDELGESYLKRVYENVNSYKTTKVGMTQDHNRLVVEGVITFGSGNKKNTVFRFTPHDATKSGRVRFLGENLQISRGHKTFILSGKISNNSLLSESLNYNYRTKDVKGNATKVYGTVKISESLKNKKLKEDRELSGKEGTASNAIVNWWKNYDFSTKNPKQIYNDLVRILPKDKLNEPKVKRLCQEILRSKTGDKAALTIGNFVLKGDKQGVINQRKDK